VISFCLELELVFLVGLYKCYTFIVLSVLGLY